MGLEGIADLPLHTGKVPSWLIPYMRRLGKAIVELIIDEFGPHELVKRFADPFWFQAFNNVIGMDWDSSGSTTVVVYVLKSIAPPQRFNELGLAVVGGKGVDARKVPEELRTLGDSVDIDMLTKSSKLAAKIDSSALQDGYELYIHSMIVSENGEWTVIQQGMNLEIKMARRYHLHGFKNIPTVEINPHTGIACNRVSEVLNLTDTESHQARKAILDIVADTTPSKLIESIANINRILRGVHSLEKWISPSAYPHRLIVEAKNKVLTNKRFYKPIANMHLVEKTVKLLNSIKPKTFDELLLTPGVGPETLRALALVADLIYGYTPSFKDPVTHPLDPFIYAYAHGGKDGIPFPVDIRTMRKTIEFLEQALMKASLDAKLKRQALRRLSQYVRRVLAATQRTTQ
ncbi:MAG TPA: DUF763 domain-containing protein [Ignisphaera aggregans]|uniref:DUF763 domain-containing protein n=1 Tax=Ignisphaera aggregans TaxID=334771 RepID=A0A833DU34_9CREN|nr:DUF763 domain-containing protein [Ignisphaera aggregans]